MLPAADAADKMYMGDIKMNTNEFKKILNDLIRGSEIRVKSIEAKLEYKPYVGSLPIEINSEMRSELKDIKAAIKAYQKVLKMIGEK